MDRRPVVLAAGACSITGAVLLLVAPGTTAWLATVILGLGLGGGFTLGLVLIADLAGSPAAASGIAAMTFLVCYLTASTAPIAVGALHDLSGGFTAPVRRPRSCRGHAMPDCGPASASPSRISVVNWPLPARHIIEIRS